MINSPNGSPEGYVLTELMLYNWGSFNGLHPVPIDPAGTALIGVTGSGKTTIVDAFMTLVCQYPRYNLASTGGNDSDRDLVSYVRGVQGLGDGENPKQRGTRLGQTITAICATFCRGNQLVRLGVVFHFEGTSSAMAELGKYWIFSTNPEQSLESWLAVFHEEGKRGLELLEKNVQGFNVHPVRRDYIAQVRALFQVGDNAFALLNRAAGVKQLTDIDSIFRDLVLDDRSAFKRAGEVVKSFDDLNVIHQELEIARAQAHKLKPIAKAWEDFQNKSQTLDEQKLVTELAPTWFAEQSHHLWSAQKNKLEDEVKKAVYEMEQLAQQRNELKQQCEMYREAYLQKGGASIDQLQKRVSEWESIRILRTTQSSQYQARMRRLGFDCQLTESVFLDNKILASQQYNSLAQQISEQRSDAFQLGINESDARVNLHGLQAELDEVKARPGSNVPTKYHDFRCELAQHLNIDEDQLPFVAEMLQVKQDEQQWRGAIERAIGGNRLRVVIPSDMAQQALQWINGRDNHLHVRVLEVGKDVEIRDTFTDGYVKKLKFKQHPYKRTVEALLSQCDRHCVDSVDDLLVTSHAMTKEGMMSGQPRFFEKRDQRHLHSDWFTGFDNRDRLSYLNQEIAGATQQLEIASDALVAARDRLGELEEAGRIYQYINEVEFDLIDLVGAENQLTDLQGQLDYLTRPDSDVASAKLLLEGASKAAEEAEGEYLQVRDTNTRLTDRLDFAIKKLRKTLDLTEQGLSPEARAVLVKYLPPISAGDLEDLDNIELRFFHTHSNAVQLMLDEIAHAEGELIKIMSDAKSVDTGALAEAGRDIDDVPTYLERLRILTTEALPEKVERFLHYLNRSSDDGVTQLLSYVEQEVVLIEERIQELNNTLRRVEFLPGKYLRLVTTKIIHKDLISLQSAQRKLNTARFTDDVGETHYRALRVVVEGLRKACDKRKTMGARAMLDSRFRLEFSVAVVDSLTKEASAGRKGSYGDSGGEKEIIASYILTAALGYALCPVGETKPLFGTVVLDEAFSRTSVSVAARIIAALNEFGLHPIFVTPNKELRLLRLHTRTAIIVHKKDGSSSLVSMSWEELERYYLNRKGEEDGGGDNGPSGAQ
ncbi:ATP-binding protein [Pseudomonas sp. NPDC089396]|uniref:ATP-binding protein n=1 Tax=Pseudomonas sp. NPDC089396 TaxID=3364461 RepID=UPI00383789AA